MAAAHGQHALAAMRTHAVAAFLLGRIQRLVGCFDHPGRARIDPAVGQADADGHLHYRSVDVSSFKVLAHEWFPRVYFNAPAKHGGHRALADILESIRELHYYRRALFVAQPGPSTEQVQTIAAEVVAEFAPNL